jgi:hypothetical protein
MYTYLFLAFSSKKKRIDLKISAWGFWTTRDGLSVLDFSSVSFGVLRSVKLGALKAQH